jgi:hypothetical protein
MTTVKTHADEPGIKEQSFSQSGRLDAVLGPIDLMAILTMLLGLALLGIGAVALAVMGLAKLLSNLCSDSFDRWLILALGLSTVWVVTRWKRLCVL